MHPIFEVVEGGRCACGDPHTDEPANIGKHPRTRSGFKDATTNLEQIEMWWTQWPNANVAIATGSISGLIIVDVDPRNGGMESLEEWDLTNEPWPRTLTALTGGGGWHWYFAYPNSGAQVSGRKLLRGVDLKADGGYVLAPPSNHLRGRYTWLAERGGLVVPYPLEAAEGGARGAGHGPGWQFDITALTEGINEGNRNENLWSLVAQLLRTYGVPPEGVEPMVKSFNTMYLKPPLADAEVRKILKSAEKWVRENTDSNIIAGPWGKVKGTGGDEEDVEVYELNDTGNACRFVDAFGDAVRFSPGLGWVLWNEDLKRWYRDDTQYVEHMGTLTVAGMYEEAEKVGGSLGNRLRLHARASGQQGRVRAMLDRAESNPLVARAASAFDTHKLLLGCANGVFDFERGGFVPEDEVRDKLVTLNTNVPLDLEYRWPEWEDFVLESCHGDEGLATFLQYAVGYTLLGETREEIFFILHGPPRSGKSTFIDGVTKALGDYAMITDPKTFAHRKLDTAPRNVIAQMRGMRAVCTVEIPEGERLAENIVKAMVGGDVIEGEFKYQNAFRFRPEFKLWMATNHEPRMQEEATFARLRSMEFGRHRTFVERDAGLKRQVNDPGVGGRAVLAWGARAAVEIVGAWGRGDAVHPLHYTEHVLRDVARYHEQEDVFGTFVRECLVVEEGAWTTAPEVFRTYQFWAAQQGWTRPWTAQTVGKRMGERGFEGTKERVEGQRVAVYRGVRVRREGDVGADSGV